MMQQLPNWYPLANATDYDIDTWLAAHAPPYDEMRAASPWLDDTAWLNAWIEGVREARAIVTSPAVLAALLPGAIDLPLPPCRSAGRAAA